MVRKIFGCPVCAFLICMLTGAVFVLPARGGEPSWRGTVKGTVIVEKKENGKITAVEHPFTLTLGLSGEIDPKALKGRVLSQDDYKASIKAIRKKLKKAQKSGTAMSPELAQAIRESAAVNRSAAGACSLVLDIPSEGTHLEKETTYGINVSDKLKLFAGDQAMQWKVWEEICGDENKIATMCMVFCSAFVIEIVDDDTIAVTASLIEDAPGNKIKVVSGALARNAGR